jgi:hypothetical protein
VDERGIARETLEAEAGDGFPRLSRVALADRGCFALRPVPGRALQTVPAYERWSAALLSGRFGGAAYQPLRLAKSTVAAGLAEEFGFSPEEAAWLAAAKPATAALLRKLIEPVFAARFGLEAESRGSGEVRHVRADEALVVRLDFGGSNDQFRVALATNEGLLGLFGSWGRIGEDTAPAAVELLAELVTVVAALPARLAASG